MHAHAPKRNRRRLAVMAATLGFALAGPLAGLANANVPNGNGQTTTSAEGLTVSCDNGFTDVIINRGGNSFWFADGSHVVTTQVIISEAGIPPISLTFGTKTGLSDSPVQCTATGTDPRTGNAENLTVYGEFVPPSD